MLRRLRIENLVLIREAELEFAPGLNALSGETGAGKTIFAQAIGLLLGQKGDASAVGPAAGEAYVEAELELPEGFFDDEELAALADLQPAGEDGLVLARRVFGDGRTRAYAWGRAIAREDAAAAAERLIAMSGQFEQRRLSRPSYQLDLLDAFAGEEQGRGRRDARVAWRELTAARRRYSELARDANAVQARLEELRALVEATDDLDEGSEERLRAERERISHVAELAQGAQTALGALTPEEGDGATDWVTLAEGALASLERLAPELAACAAELRSAELELRETASSLSGFLASLEVEPDRLEQLEAELDRIAQAKRRFRCLDFAELMERAAAARAELAQLDEGIDPLTAAETEMNAAEERVRALARELRTARQAAAEPFAQAVAAELKQIGLGEGEFRVELAEHEPGPSGSDETVFLIRPNRGLPFAPVAETASGGELSRIALALAAVAAANAGGETLVFDEIDAGIGGRTANTVADTLERLGARAQVLTITHLPQIASRAERHFVVEKIPGDPTHTRIDVLGPSERSAEIERMLGGEEFLAAIASLDAS
ncbi:MAG TPA: AAA family ATPase [Gaiellaceae bacterium]